MCKYFNNQITYIEQTWRAERTTWNFLTCWKPRTCIFRCPDCKYPSPPTWTVHPCEPSCTFHLNIYLHDILSILIFFDLQTIVLCAINWCYTKWHTTNIKKKLKMKLLFCQKPVSITITNLNYTFVTKLNISYSNYFRLKSILVKIKI